MRDYTEKRTEEDTFDDDREQIENKPNSITVTGKEWWMRNYGLTEELPCPQDEIDDSNLSQAYEDTPLSSLDVSVTGDHGDTDKVEYNQGGATAWEMSDRIQRDDCEFGMGA